MAALRSRMSVRPMRSPNNQMVPVEGKFLGGGESHEGGFAGAVGSDDDPALPSSHLPCDVGNKRALIAD